MESNLYSVNLFQNLINNQQLIQNFYTSLNGHTGGCKVHGYLRNCTFLYYFNAHIHNKRAEKGRNVIFLMTIEICKIRRRSRENLKVNEFCVLSQRAAAQELVTCEVRACHFTSKVNQAFQSFTFFFFFHKKC